MHIYPLCEFWGFQGIVSEESGLLDMTLCQWVSGSQNDSKEYNAYSFQELKGPRRTPDMSVITG